jgi:hypothetical protein
MKNTKLYALALFLLGTVNTFAANSVQLPKSIDANMTREAIGFDAVTVVPLLILAVFLVVLYFASQKVPGLKE